MTKSSMRPNARRNQTRLSRLGHEAAPPHRLYRQFAAAPLRDRDLHHRPAQASPTSTPQIDTAIVAMNDHGQTYDYPARSQFQIKDDKLEDYVACRRRS